MLSSTVSADLNVRPLSFLVFRTELLAVVFGFCLAAVSDFGGGMAFGRGRKLRAGASAVLGTGDLERGGMANDTETVLS